MRSTYKKLLLLYKPIYQQHLIFCLNEYKDYYDDSFRFNGVDKRNNTIINDKVITPQDIAFILALYYEDSINDYQTPFGDFVYLCFTDLADKSVDILELLENEETIKPSVYSNDNHPSLTSQGVEK